MMQEEKKMKRRPRCGAAAHVHSSPRRLREEIATLERRLAEIGPDGDCGYEKVLIRFFQQQIGERQASLQASAGLST